MRRALVPVAAALATLFAIAAAAAAHEETAGAPRRAGAPAVRDVGFDQRIGGTLPVGLPFVDDTGAPVSLERLLGDRPAILVFTQYACPNLCPLALEELVASLRATRLRPGEDYVVVLLSIDQREGPREAARRKAQLLSGTLRSPERPAWHFLTGNGAAIAGLADAAGFRFAYDPSSDRFAHPAGVIVLTGQGRIARYLFGLDFPPRDVRLALVDAAQGRLGSLLDRVMLVCYRYDAGRGRYTPVVMNVVRAGGALTVLGLGVMLALLLRAERARKCP